VIPSVVSTFRSCFEGLTIANGGYDKIKGNQILETGQSDLVSFGRLFIANPDLPERFALDGPLNELDFATIYGKPDRNLEDGYTDYPSLN
jgi:N-ethylmaleimide reductase